YASQRLGYTPFVLRINIGLQPFARNQPYDTYSTIGFFSTGYQPSPGSDDTCAMDNSSGSSPARDPYVLPLLVTDNLEGISTARSAEVITQIALAVSVLAQGIAGEASFGSTRDRLKSVLGTDLNALLTVSRAVDNAIQVRIGAASQPTSRFATIPGNRTVTVLLLVPNEQFDIRQDYLGRLAAPTVRVMMKTVLRNALDGQVLPFDRSKLFEALSPSLERIGFSKQAIAIATAGNPSILSSLIFFVQTQQRDRFNGCLQSLKARDRTVEAVFPDSVWVVLAETISRSDFQTASVSLCDPNARPRPLKCKIFTDIPPKTSPVATPKAVGTVTTGGTTTTTTTTTTAPPR
ncbi:MAG: hypothetical protein PSV22_08945, partial [Pseudolabrys sp.]|nr:hypothetical protein [Pseudolabrys sp.]